MRALLDVKVLIALLDVDHVHHRRAQAWLGAAADHGWASCPITQNGCIRIMSQAAYPNPLPVRAVMDRLAAAARRPEHRFWPDDVTLLAGSLRRTEHVLRARDVTDLYLVALAVKHRGRFATFDEGIPITEVRGASPDRLAVI
jgi:toxin-antitoxin system PIN domain toxin